MQKSGLIVLFKSEILTDNIISLGKGVMKLKECLLENTKQILEFADTEEAFIKSRSDSDKTLYEVMKDFSNSKVFRIFEVINEENKSVGIVSAFPHKDPNTLSLGIMYILPEHRGKGYGKLMIKLFIEYARKEGFKKIYTKTWSSNIASKKVFNKLGFKEISRVENDRVNGDSTVKYLLSC